MKLECTCDIIISILTLNIKKMSIINEIKYCYTGNGVI